MIARGCHISLVVVTASVMFFSCAAEGARREDPKMNKEWNPLTPDEERIIGDKDTEPPFSGEYYDFDENGTYICKRCGAALFPSESKFHSGCGWPSFDDALPGAVRELPDPDGRRTEIVCNACGGHLGHVFRGEGYTARNTRHCVNSLSLDFEPAQSGTEVAYFAGGCFWGVEYHFGRLDGVLSAESGYMGGTTKNPTYEQVCSGRTGHVEAVRVVFDPERISYPELARLFFEIHDPTQVDRQGPDVGNQYRSVAFYVDEFQQAVADELMQELRRRGFDVATQFVPATTFWPAEDYHQDYYEKSGRSPVCHIRVPRFDP